MTEALALIAEAQKRQANAERTAEYWKGRASRERQRCRITIEAAKRRPIEPPTLYGGLPEWKWTEKLVSDFVTCIQDPHAAFDSDDRCEMTHVQAEAMIAYRIEDAIKAALKNQQST
jgi:hypothetical protein